MKFLKGNFEYVCTDGFHYQLKEIRPEDTIFGSFFTINTAGLMIVKPGFPTDGASVVGSNEYNFVGACVHDVLYRCFRQGWLDRKWIEAADDELGNLMRLYGAKEWVTDTYEFFVDRFGHKFTKSSERWDELELPDPHEMEV